MPGKSKHTQDDFVQPCKLAVCYLMNIGDIIQAGADTPNEAFKDATPKTMSRSKKGRAMQ